MTGSVASASNSPQRILIVVPNWLGDGIMAMPAVQLLRDRLSPEGSIDVLTKKGQTKLWEMHPSVSNLWEIPDTKKDLHSLLMGIHLKAYTQAVILPNSFRSALIPFRAKISSRRGTQNQLGRRWLINDPVTLLDLEPRHQQWEMARLLLGDPLPDSLPSPRLTAPDDSVAKINSMLSSQTGPTLGLIPGAARGPSKQWPGERFQAVASTWVAQTGGSVCWLGTPEDKDLCEKLNAPLGPQGLVLAGSTTLQEFATALSCMQVILANDSGGMHLATAMGTPVVGIFGITDPAKTGPLSEQATVLQHSNLRNRRVPRESEEASAALAAVTAEEAFEAVLAFLRDRSKES